MIPDTTHNINLMPFSTFDNPHSTANPNCAKGSGGWWYNNCAFGVPLGGPGVYFRWFYAAGEGMLLQTSRLMVKKINT